MNITRATITPELANYFLAKNTSNRPVKKSIVDLYANVMRQGNWKLSHQGIAISSDDVLIDGQHRLLAIVKSGVSVEMLVSTGMDRNMFSVIDNHAKRSDSDRLKYDRVLLSVAIKMHLLAFGKHTSDKMQDDELIRIATLIKPYQEMLIAASKKKVRVFSSASAQCAFIVAMINYPNRQDELVTKYANFTNMKSENFTQSMHSLNRILIKANVRSCDGIDFASKIYNAITNDDLKIIRSGYEQTLIAKIKSIIE